MKEWTEKQKKWVMMTKIKWVMGMETKMMTMRALILIWTNTVMKIVRIVMKSLNFQVKTR